MRTTRRSLRHTQMCTAPPLPMCDEIVVGMEADKTRQDSCHRCARVLFVSFCRQSQRELAYILARVHSTSSDGKRARQRVQETEEETRDGKDTK